MAESKRCHSCDEPLPERARFCLLCGKPVGLARQTTLRSEEDVTRPDPSAHVAPARHLAPGTHVSDVYTVSSIVGEGGMGVVYEAHDAARDHTVALGGPHATAPAKRLTARTA